MSKYLKLIKDFEDKKKIVSEYLKNNNISYTSFDISDNEVKLKMSSVERFSFEFVRGDMISYLEENNLRLSKH